MIMALWVVHFHDDDEDDRERKKELRPTWNAPRLDYIYPAQRILFLTWLRIIITDSHLHEYLMVSHQLNRNGYQSVRGRYVARLLLNFFLSFCFGSSHFVHRCAQCTGHEFPNECEYDNKKRTAYKSKCWCSFFISFVFHSQIFLFFHFVFFCSSYHFCCVFHTNRRDTHRKKKKQNRNDTELSDHFVMSSHKMCSQME